MRNIRLLPVWLCLLAAAAHAQELPWVIESLAPNNEFTYDMKTGSATGTNGVIIKYQGATLVADRVTLDQKSGEALADGHVRIERDEQVWVGEHISYNFKTHQMQTEEFRSGRPPVFVAGGGLSGDAEGKVYSANNAMLTTDDYSEPAIKIRARRIEMIPGQYIKCRDAWVMIGGMPVFYLPYYKRNLGDHANNFNFTPGYRSRFGPFLLTHYDWYLNDELSGMFRLDYRAKRGIGVGPDITFDLGEWGQGVMKYYYAHDQRPSSNANGVNVKNNRQRFDLSYIANPATNLTVRSQIRYQNDPLFIRDFFEGEYSQNIQPSTYVEINKFWSNFSLDTVVQPRVNDFLQTVERLPDIRLTGFRQQLGDTPFYYQSESSYAYLRERYAWSNGVPLLPNSNYAAIRSDTHQEILMPETFFGWLNVTPHVGGRYTYYGKANGAGASTPQISRGVLDTGTEVSFKASRTWNDTRSRLFDLSGLRHIIEPSVDYEFVPTPNRTPKSLPQFDTALPGLALQPVDFPEMNSIDSIDSQNVVRLGLHNKLQTKRNGEVADFLDWQIFTDWRLARANNQTNVTSFNDIYSDLKFAPRDWIAFESQTRFDIADRRWRLAYHNVTFTPNNVWSWSLGHYYVHDDPVLGSGNNLVSSRFYYRFDENWGFQLGHDFEARNGRLQDQYYTIYRDLRSWTTAVTFRVNDNGRGADDYTIAITFSLKSIPRFGLGGDSVRPFPLFGG